MTGSRIMRGCAVIGVAVLAIAPAGARKAPDTGTPAAVTQLLQCRALADSAARLACYDGQATKIEQQIAAKELVVIDKARADQARRSLFGYSVPNFGGLFGVGGKDDISQIEVAVASLGRNPTGGMVVRLTDGSVWSQVDDWEPPTNPKKGELVTVKRGMMGSYYMEFKKSPGIKVKRVD